MVTPDAFPLVVPNGTPDEVKQQANNVAEQWGFKLCRQTEQPLSLLFDDRGLALCSNDASNIRVQVDFASDMLTYRRLHGGGRKEAIAKAVGIKSDYLPRVLDATAGQGRDAFVLASLGCQIHMIERSEVAAALLQDALSRATLHVELNQWLPARMQLCYGSAIDLLADWQQSEVDVVYLDPMFPHRKKSAAVKKEMHLFQQLLGADEDADSLLKPALLLAKKRVVVKRPNSAPWLAEKQPNMAISSKKHRFDVYLTNL